MASQCVVHRSSQRDFLFGCLKWQNIVSATCIITEKPSYQTACIDVFFTHACMQASPPPIGATSLRFHIQVWSRRLSGDILTENLTQTDFEFTLTGLSPNTSYSLGVRPDVRYLDVCRSYFAGPYSRPLSITTNDICKFIRYPVCA